MQGIEPTARLVNSFANIISRVLRFEFLLILKRIMPLGVRHRTRVEPDVDQILNAVHLPAALRTSVMNLVDVRPMQVEITQIASNLFGQFLHRSDSFAMFAASALPDRERRAPIPFTTQRPINVIRKPISKASFANMFRNPIDCIVQFNQPVAELAGADVP